jgi:hypothetical protein
MSAFLLYICPRCHKRLIKLPDRLCRRCTLEQFFLSSLVERKTGVKQFRVPRLLTFSERIKIIKAVLKNSQLESSKLELVPLPKIKADASYRLRSDYEIDPLQNKEDELENGQKEEPELEPFIPPVKGLAAPIWLRSDYGKSPLGHEKEGLGIRREEEPAVETPPDPEEELKAKQEVIAKSDLGFRYFRSYAVKVALYLLIALSFWAYANLGEFSLRMFQAAGIWILGVVIYLTGVKTFVLFDTDLAAKRIGERVTSRLPHDPDELLRNMLAFYDLEEAGLSSNIVLAYVWLVAIYLTVVVGITGMLASVGLMIVGNILAPIALIFLGCFIGIGSLPNIQDWCDKKGKDEWSDYHETYIDENQF